MTRTIKNNLIRVLTFLVAITCAFSILTMPRTSASADSTNVVAEDSFWMENEVKLNATSEQKTGIQFTAGAGYAWCYAEGTGSIKAEYEGAKNVVFGIVIADKKYLDENGDVQERSDITVDTDNAITIAYLNQEDFNKGGYFTNYKTYYTGSIIYREEKLKNDFIAHDEAVKAQVAAGEIDAEDAKYYFENGNYNDAQFEVLMDRVHGEQLMARAYVEITTANDEKVYLYSYNTITASVRGVATGKYLDNKDDESWMAQYGWVATKYLGEISYKNAHVDMESGEIVGADLRGYEEFTMGDKTLTVGDSQLDADLVIGEKSYFGISLSADKVIGQTYTLTATDSLGNMLFLNVTPVTKVLKTAEDIYNTFNLSTNNKTYCKPAGNFYSCTVDGYFVLGNDINMSGVKLDHNLVCSYNTNTVAPAFGVGFYGTFDGNGYTISNLDLSRTGAGIYQMTSNGDFLQTSKTDGVIQQAIGAYSYRPTIAANHTCGHSSGTGVGLFGALGYGTSIKNVALTNVKASNGSVIAMFTEGGYNQDTGVNTYNAFGGFEEVDSTDYMWRAGKIGTACTGDDSCTVHGKEDCTATAGKKFVQCSGTAFCVYHQTTEAHDVEWVPVYFTGSSNDYIAFATETIMVRKASMLTAAQAKITYENLYIDINSDTTSFRGVFNSFGAAKVDAITTMNNIVINYNGAVATASNTGILRGENKVATTGGQGIVFGSTTKNNVVVISANDANLINYSGNYVASNVTKDGATQIAGILQYASLDAYKTAISEGEATLDGFADYWSTKAGVPVWKKHYDDGISFKVNGEDVGNTYNVTTLADGSEKTVQVTAYNYLGTQFAEFDSVSTSNETVAIVTKEGLITLITSNQNNKATATITLSVEGKEFVVNVTLEGGFVNVSAEKVITYSQDEGRFDFGGYAFDPDNNAETDNSIVFTNDTIVSATVIYNGASVDLTKQTIQVRDYGTLANGQDWTANPGGVGSNGSDSGNGYNTTGDQATNPRYDSTKAFNAFLGADVVRYSVTKDENGNYVPDLKTQQLFVTINVGTEEEPEYKSFLFNNLKAYTAIITNVGQLSDVFAIKASGQVNEGYYILANGIDSSRGGYQIAHNSSYIASGYFQGVFDGQGFQINGLRPSVSNAGLFGVIKSTEEIPTTIRNVSFVQYDAGHAQPVILAKSIISDVYDDVAADGENTIKVAKYPVEIYNVHVKASTRNLHGFFYASAGTVNYKFRNVLVNVESLSSYQTIGASNFFAGQTQGLLVNTANYGYTGGDQIKHIEYFARDAYYSDAYENVVVISTLPVMLNVKNTTTNGVTGKEPLDTYHLAYGMNKVGKAGTNIAKYAQANNAATPSNSANLVFEVLGSQAKLTPFVGTEENSYADATPWATQLVEGQSYTVDDTTIGTNGTYTTAQERAYFFKGIYQYYSLYDMTGNYNNEESGEKAMFDAFVETGYFVKRTKALGHDSDDTKLVWHNAFVN